MLAQFEIGASWRKKRKKRKNVSSEPSVFGEVQAWRRGSGEVLDWARNGAISGVQSPGSNVQSGERFGSSPLIPLLGRGAEGERAWGDGAICWGSG